MLVIGYSKLRRTCQTYTLHKSFIVPRAEQPASALDTVQEDNSHEEGLKPASLLALKQTALEVIDDRLA
jgi:hypothetical protein